MAETRVSYSLHFLTDPAKQVIGMIEIPGQITKTIAIGEKIITEKVDVASLPTEAIEQIKAEIGNLAIEQGRKARPVATPAATASTPATPTAKPAATPVEEPESGTSVF